MLDFIENAMTHSIRAALIAAGILLLALIGLPMIPDSIGFINMLPIKMFLATIALYGALGAMLVVWFRDLTTGYLPKFLR